MTARKFDSELGSAVYQELQAVRKEQAALRIIQLYEETELEGELNGNHSPKTLADEFIGGRSGLPRRSNREKRQRALAQRRAVLEALDAEIEAEEEQIQAAEAEKGGDE